MWRGWLRLWSAALQRKSSERCSPVCVMGTVVLDGLFRPQYNFWLQSSWLSRHHHRRPLHHRPKSSGCLQEGTCPLGLWTWALGQKSNSISWDGLSTSGEKSSGCISPKTCRLREGDLGPKFRPQGCPSPRIPPGLWMPPPASPLHWGWRGPVQEYKGG